MTSTFKPGTKVRLKGDPSHRGMISDGPKMQGNIRKYKVFFSQEDEAYFPEYDLEVINSDDDNLYWKDSLAEGRFGRVRDLRRNLTHIHLSGRLANLVYSMDATNTDFYAYQYKPVLSFLESPSKGLLIADEVGLGKTIEAGLIWTELRARYDARRLMVVCPAMLKEKWRIELNDKFGVDATIMDAADLLQHLQHIQQDKYRVPDGKGIICSIQGLRPPKSGEYNAKAKLADFLGEHLAEEPFFDLVIIDESHHLRNPESQNAKLGQLLRDVTDQLVLLSATPINLKHDDLFHQLKLLDPDSFPYKEIFPEVLAANEHLLEARTLVLNTNSDMNQIKEKLVKAQTHRLLSNNRQLADLVTSDRISNHLDERPERIKLANEIEKINLLSDVITRTRKKEVTEWRVVRRPVKCFVKLDKNGAEWKFYQLVTEAIREYAQKSGISEGFLLANPQRQVSSCMYAAAMAWKEKDQQHEEQEEQIYEDLGYDSDDIDSKPLITHLHNEVLPRINSEELRRNDSKYREFRDTIVEYLKKDKTNRREKIIVFSYYRKTLSYLSERLKEDEIQSQILVGGTKETKQEIIQKFRDDEDIQVLLSSEVASEGVDLQFCRILVNYDLPWNPMKVEQRIGRIDRIGQQAENINIINLLHADTIDHRIHDRLYERLRIFERALGGMEAILGEEISKLTSDLLKRPLNPEQEKERIEQTAMAIERIRHDQDQLENQASQMIAHGGYILEQVQAAHQFKKRITREDLMVYVKDYLEKYCQGFEFHQPSIDEYRFDLRLPASTTVALGSFIKKQKLHGLTRLATGEKVSCEFANKVRSIGNRNEIISQFHPLIRFIAKQLKDQDEKFYPMVSVKLIGSKEIEMAPGAYAFFINRWEFSGIKTEEEIAVRVVNIETDELISSEKSQALINRARVEGTDWLEVNNALDMESLNSAMDKCSNSLEKDYNIEVNKRENKNMDRIAIQIKSAKNHQARKTHHYKETLEKYRSSEDPKMRGMIPPTKGKIEKIDQKFATLIEKLQSKRQLIRRRWEAICYGVILIQ